LKPINYLAVAALALFTSTSVAQQSSTIKKSKKTLVWNDEFNKNGLPDTSKWVYEEGFMRNKESQYYTARPENCFVKNGKLTIRLQHIPPQASIHLVKKHLRATFV
jgi:hypothetical protein